MLLEIIKLQLKYIYIYYVLYVQLLTNLPKGYDDFIFSYFKYYNKLDPNGFQFSLQNVVLRKPEIIEYLYLWKKKYSDIVLCDFLNNKINEYKINIINRFILD